MILVRAGPWTFSVDMLRLERRLRRVSKQSARLVAKIAFSVDRGGHVTEVRVIAPSGSSDLDEPALHLIQRSQPLASPPASLSPRLLSFVASVQFAPYAPKWLDPAS